MPNVEEALNEGVLVPKILVKPLDDQLWHVSIEGAGDPSTPAHLALLLCGQSHEGVEAQQMRGRIFFVEEVEGIAKEDPKRVEPEGVCGVECSALKSWADAKFIQCRENRRHERAPHSKCRW